MLATPSVSYPHVTIDDVGVARVAGTRLKVKHLVGAKRAGNWSADELVEQFPGLTLAEVHGALTYYYDHQSELDAEMQRDVDWAEQQRPMLESAELRSTLLARIAARNQP